MDKNISEQYYLLYEKMVSIMTDTDNYTREKLIEVLCALSELFNIAKGVTEYYKSISDEKLGIGETMIDYDNGKGSVPVVHHRFVSRSQTVVKITLYIADDAEPLSDWAREKLNIIARTLLSYISRNRMQAAVETLGFHDETGYPNLRAFKRYVGSLIADGIIAQYSAVHFNLRHFAVINQEIGRDLGDIVIKRYFDTVAELIGDNGIVCRIGGDNFIAAFKKDLIKPMLEIMNGVPVYYDEGASKRVIVSSSAGIVEVEEKHSFRKSEQLLDKLMAVSNIARRKENGRIVFYDEKMEIMKEKSLRIQRLFPNALEKREFKVFYQPKVDILTGRIVGGEALCRWFHEGAFISPGEFIPILERNTDICELDFYMLDSVCRDIRRWLDEGKNAVRISVNLSRKHLVDPDLLEHILTIIDSNSVPHDLIEIELTETTTDVEFRDLKRISAGLQAVGIFTSVDDFGVGYSSLNLIREIQWNVLKIDRCFLPADEDPEDSITSLMYRHVIAMAREIGLECITEGVETIKQVEILRKNNCTIAQGFFFDKPLPVEEFEEKLKMLYYSIDDKEI